MGQLCESLRQLHIHGNLKSPHLLMIHWLWGSSAEQRSWCMIRYVALWTALGMDVAWRKADRGCSIVWIGFSLQLSEKQDDFTVVLTEEKQAKLVALTDDISSRRGMVPLHLLEHAVGILDWATSAIPMLWVAILRKRDPTKQSTRVRKGLVFVTQVEVATTWLRQLVTESDSRKGCLSRTYRWRPQAPAVLIHTDACHTGLGGFIMVSLVVFGMAMM